jgi:hypothetical protein
MSEATRQVIMSDFKGLSAIQERIRAEIKSHIENMKSGQDWMLARIDVFEEQLDKMNAAWKTCLENEYRDQLGTQGSRK